MDGEHRVNFYISKWLRIGLHRSYNVANRFLVSKRILHTFFESAILFIQIGMWFTYVVKNDKNSYKRSAYDLFKTIIKVSIIITSSKQLKLHHFRNYRWDGTPIFVEILKLTNQPAIIVVLACGRVYHEITNN